MRLQQSLRPLHPARGELRIHPHDQEHRMSRDPLRDQPTQPGEQHGKRDAEHYEDRGAGDAPDTLVPANGDTPAKKPGTAPSTVADR
ncbi:hypothetical protein XPR_2994 [Xanthomonas arboricola pv. pruni MAFF 301420]|uniref:Uncharacterized protein n=6 Tax=Xanthomonas arboricola TaxID=56448 RepID=W4SK54_9XANT|nr:hypothetical protein XPU_0015 [Xanthomonas arboricola pv. pruni str. MAFF 311562]GAE56359.1 hypothetical protein XPR_2994 [Xanthomonas arboricola pv. pruni MAFF 301420]GAE58745.1 hypothetical protein XPN_0651 [Xanthomonas arboricola pv. pruni MAFF 301427]